MRNFLVELFYAGRIVDERGSLGFGQTSPLGESVQKQKEFIHQLFGLTA